MNPQIPNSASQGRKTPMVAIAIEPRFNGFQDIALGGYVGGVLASGHGKAEVALRRPVLVGKAYQMATEPDGSRTLRDGDNLLAVSSDVSVDLDMPSPVRFDDAEAASERYPGFRRHLIPTCFTCGPLRAEGDGLRIFPGRASGHDVVVAPWAPPLSLADSTGRVKPEFVWSALDCPTIWALIILGNPDANELAVTARLAVDLISPVRAGEPHVVMGWKVSNVGRTRLAGGAIYSADGRLLAKARHTLVATNWGVPMGLNHWQ